MLKEIFEKHEGRLIHKWDHYFEIYERFFSPFRDTAMHMLEIGISHGGSLQLWRKYFGERANLYAIDINPECRQFGEEKTRVFIGSQEDPVFLAQIARTLPPLDVVLDDGGHTMNQQIVSFRHLFPLVRDGGLYIVEDTHTSYWHAFHGGFRKKGTFIEFAKGLVDDMHAWHIDNEKIQPVNTFTEHISCISFYDSIVVIEKKKRKEPFHSMKGSPVITPYTDPTLRRESLLARIRKKLFSVKESSFSRQLRK